FASGLLLLCVGWTTRLAEYLAALPKTYRAVIRLGERTDTDDRTGTVTTRSEAWRAVDAEQVHQAL
ncbi:MAG: pseudouridine synthase, partial [Gemmatimonadales bacterium]|nr:pseudouridine synthase [Gemmatimonadales bacterium]